MVQLVTRADDAGGCASANEAIREAVEAGAIKNVSIMACGEAIEQAAEFFSEIEGVCLGLHVTLNAEWDRVKWGPVLSAEEVPSLLEPGLPYFTPTPKALQEKGFVIEEAVAEVGAQLARARSLGLNISYLDEHMGVGWIQSGGQRLRDALAAFCVREGLMDVHTLSLSGIPRAADMPSPPTPDAQTLTEDWLQRLSQAPAGTYLLVTHPGKVAIDMEMFYHEHTGQQPGEVAAERDREREALAHTDFVSRCAAQGTSLLRYDEVR
ncbi:MAG: hypothetical protein OHK0029_08360 [Armatimonadaceae bacterium]